MRFTLVSLEYAMVPADERLGDPTFSSLMSRPAAPFVPVLQLFGHWLPEVAKKKVTKPTPPETPTSSSRQAATISLEEASLATLPTVCVHMHHVLPYFYVPQYDARVTPVQFASQLEAVAIERWRLPLHQRRLVHHVAIVEALPFYGYFEAPRHFFKVFVYHPMLVTRLANLLGSSTLVGGRQWQPYESHLPYAFQFMIDRGLSGMGTVPLSFGTVRRGDDDDDHRRHATKVHSATSSEAGDHDAPPSMAEQWLAAFHEHIEPWRGGVDGEGGLFWAPREWVLSKRTCCDIEIDATMECLPPCTTPGSTLSVVKRSLKEYLEAHEMPLSVLSDAIAPVEGRFGTVERCQSTDPMHHVMLSLLQRYSEGRSTNIPRATLAVGPPREAAAAVGACPKATASLKELLGLQSADERLVAAADVVNDHHAADDDDDDGFNVARMATFAMLDELAASGPAPGPCTLTASEGNALIHAEADDVLLPPEVEGIAIATTLPKAPISWRQRGARVVALPATVVGGCGGERALLPLASPSHHHQQHRLVLALVLPSNHAAASCGLEVALGRSDGGAVADDDDDDGDVLLFPDEVPNDDDPAVLVTPNGTNSRTSRLSTTIPATTAADKNASVAVQWFLWPEEVPTLADSVQMLRKTGRLHQHEVVLSDIVDRVSADVLEHLSEAVDVVSSVPLMAAAAPGSQSDPTAVVFCRYQYHTEGKVLLRVETSLRELLHRADDDEDVDAARFGDVSGGEPDFDVVALPELLEPHRQPLPRAPSSTEADDDDGDDDARRHDTVRNPCIAAAVVAATQAAAAEDRVVCVEDILRHDDGSSSALHVAEANEDVSAAALWLPRSVSSALQRVESTQTAAIVEAWHRSGSYLQGDDTIDASTEKKRTSPVAVVDGESGGDGRSPVGSLSVPATALQLTKTPTTPARAAPQGQKPSPPPAAASLAEQVREPTRAASSPITSADAVNGMDRRTNVVAWSASMPVNGDDPTIRLYEVMVTSAARCRVQLRLVDSVSIDDCSVPHDGVPVAAKDAPLSERRRLLCAWVREQVADSNERQNASLQLNRGITPPSDNGAAPRGKKVFLSLSRPSLALLTTVTPRHGEGRDARAGGMRRDRALRRRGCGVKRSGSRRRRGDPTAGASYGATAPTTCTTSSAQMTQSGTLLPWQLTRLPHLSIDCVEVLADAVIDTCSDPTKDALYAVAVAHSTTWREGADVTVIVVTDWPLHVLSSVADQPAPALKSTGGTSSAVEAVKSEAELLRRVLEVLKQRNADIVMSWDPIRMGLGYVAERMRRVLRMDFFVELGRLRPSPQQERRFGHHGAAPSHFHAPQQPYDVKQESSWIKQEVVSDDEHGSDNDDEADTESPRRGNFAPRTSAVLQGQPSRHPTLRISGRIPLNLSKICRSEVKQTSYTLQAIHQSLFGSPLPAFGDGYVASLCRMGFSARSQMEKHHASNAAPSSCASPEDACTTADRLACARLAFHILRDRVILPLRVARHLDIFVRTAELSQLYGILFAEVLSRGSQFRVESFMLRYSKPRGYLTVSPSREQVMLQNRQEGIPLVMEPYSGFYKDPVVVLDFRSLYPSMVIAYNLCYATCAGKISKHDEAKLGAIGGYPVPWGALKRQLGTGCNGTSQMPQPASPPTFAPTSCMYMPSSVRAGILPEMLECILDTRFQVQAVMQKAAAAGDATARRVFDAQQLGLKMLANVTYGYSAATFTGRMPCSDVADSIVLLGRATLERAIRLIEGHPTWRAKVVYGDTDSLFVHLPGRSRDEAFTLGAAMAREVTAMNPHPVTLKFEKVYHPCLLITKKRYVGYSWDKQTATSPNFDAKGIETVRRDQCAATAKIMTLLLRCLMDHGGALGPLRNLFAEQAMKLASHDVNPTDVILRREVRLGSYAKDSTLPPAARVALRGILRDAASAPLHGERVPYVVVTASWKRKVDGSRGGPCESPSAGHPLHHSRRALHAKAHLASPRPCVSSRRCGFPRLVSAAAA